MDNAVLNEKDRNIEIALECINYRLKEEKAKDTVNSIKFDLQEIRRKDEYQYCYENFGDDKGRFIFPFLNITVQMYPCSEGTDTGSLAL